MKRRTVLALVLFATPLVVVGVACSFPDVSFGPPDASSNADVATTTQPDTGSATGDSGPDVVDQDIPDGGGLPTDGQALDAVTRTEASAPVEAGQCSSEPRCDCDNDNYLDKNCDAGAATPSGKDGGDCDDLDPLRHPNQDYVDIQTSNGDWNCNGVVEKGIADGAWCKFAVLGGGIASCTKGYGFSGTIDCGVVADIYACESTGLGKCGLQLAVGLASPKQAQVCK